MEDRITQTITFYALLTIANVWGASQSWYMSIPWLVMAAFVMRRRWVELFKGAQ